MIRTPFHTRTSVRCESMDWRNWSGYLAAGSYELNHEREYFAVRTTAGLFDTSPLFKYRIQGPEALLLTNRIVTRDVARCRIGQVLYTPWCDDRGYVIEDGLVWRLDEDIFYMTAAEPNLHWLLKNGHGLQVEIEDVTDSLAALAIQGPYSREILNSLVDIDLSVLPYYHLTQGYVDGSPVIITRTGYTGDLGYEIWVDARHAIELWDALMRAGRTYQLTPFGLIALDMVRVEAGLLLIDVDYISAWHAEVEAQKSTPYELNLGWTVDLDKAHFLGRSALLEHKKRGPGSRFVGLEVSWESLERIFGEFGLPPKLPNQAWRGSTPIMANNQWVGYATSGSWSPILKKYVVMGHLDVDHASPGTQVKMQITVEHKQRQAEAVVVEKPFFDPDRKKSVRS